MRIFSDWHHGGLGRSIALTLGHRLGHDVFFPSGEFASWACSQFAGAWLTPNVASNGGVPDALLNERGELANVIGQEEFLASNWDAVLMSRPESEPLFRDLLARHPAGHSIRRIGQAGNEGSVFDWDFVPNFLSSDYLSFVRAPSNINKLHYMQELGSQFAPATFTPLTQADLTRVNTFINCLDSFHHWQWNGDASWNDGRCPHCDASHITSLAPVSISGIWHEMKAGALRHEFRDYGINNSLGMQNERDMPALYLSGALTWGYKTYDGWGHSLAQSVSMGRLVLVPRRFHRYRTANQFLIPNLTCFEAEWTSESCLSVIRWFSESLERANWYSECCFHAAQAIFNWEKEALRVKDFIAKLR